MKRIAIGQVLQETNLLNPVETRREDFADYGLAQGDEVVARYGDVGELAGLTTLPDACNEAIEWLGLLRAVAWHGGPLAAESVERWIIAGSGTTVSLEIGGHGNRATREGLGRRSAIGRGQGWAAGSPL